MSEDADLVFKILRRSVWAQACAAGTWRGSADDVRDGFIHFSTRAQVAGTLEKHFAGQADLLLVGFAAADLGPALKWEASRGGALFPHLYGPLDPALARSVDPLP